MIKHQVRKTIYVHPSALKNKIPSSEKAAQTWSFCHAIAPWIVFSIIS